ncbi:aldolase [Vibrio sp. CK2-1]|uniref:3-oxo-tetronate 4-phosphate decarboxylase n=1 Tax=Vibrio sp. CK2-1 TaxID=2912249 RepID=UPI001F1BB0C7|nr:aldolase [Vibrio sp. CK2-1]MCF7353167.1 aldolase [Vibrio sp. CK2-1]
MTDYTQQYATERAQMVKYGLSLFQRGYATGGAGNLSILLADGNVLATPTGSCLGELVAERLSVVTLQGDYLAGDKPSKEVDFHREIYQSNSDHKAIVHLHCTYLTALSCLKELDYSNAMRAFTPYYVMRVGALPMIPYYRPGSPKIAEDLSRLSVDHNAILMANHGVTVMGKSLQAATYNLEELEETAKLKFILPENNTRYLSDDEVQELKVSYSSP